MSFCLTSVSDGIGTSTFATAKVQHFLELCKNLRRKMRSARHFAGIGMVCGEVLSHLPIGF